MSLLHLDVRLDLADLEYLTGAIRERGLTFGEFAKEALMEWAAR